MRPSCLYLQLVFCVRRRIGSDLSKLLNNHTSVITRHGVTPYCHHLSRVICHEYPQSRAYPVSREHAANLRSEGVCRTPFVTSLSQTAAWQHGPSRLFAPKALVLLRDTRTVSLSPGLSRSSTRRKWKATTRPPAATHSCSSAAMRRQW